MVKHRGILFVILFTCGMLISFANSQNASSPNVVLFWYKTDKFVLLCVRKDDSGLPALFSKKAEKYDSVPVMPKGTDDDKEKIANALKDFKWSLVGAADESQYQDKLKIVQKQIKINSDGSWGPGTITALINYLKSEIAVQTEVMLSMGAEDKSISMRMINLNNISEANNSGAQDLQNLLNRQKLLLALQSYDSAKMENFGTQLVEAYKKSDLDLPIKSSPTGKKTISEQESKEQKIPVKSESSEEKLSPRTSTENGNFLSRYESNSLIFVLIVPLLVINFLVLILLFIVLRSNGVVKSKLSEQKKDIDELSNEIRLKIKPKIESTANSVQSVFDKQQKIDDSLDQIKSDAVPKIFSELSHLSDRLAVKKKPLPKNYSSEVDTIIRETEEMIERVAQCYKDGEGVDLSEMEEPNSSEQTLHKLNAIALKLSEWIKEVQQSPSQPAKLVSTLTNAKKVIMKKLREIRGNSIPDPPEQLPTFYAQNRSELETIRKQCDDYVQKYSDKLIQHEQHFAENHVPSAGEVIDSRQYDKFISSFITNHLLDGVAKLFPYDDKHLPTIKLPKQLSCFLGLLGYEIIDIEIGETVADAHYHTIRGSRPTRLDNGTVVELISHGLRSKKDQRVIRDPVVIRGV